MKDQLVVERLVGSLKKAVGAYPAAKRFCMPAWRIVKPIFWSTRLLLVGERPIVVSVDQTLTALLLPRGQLAARLWLGDFETPERAFVSHWLKPDMLVVNAGANIGLYALSAALLVGEGGRVHAFEPSKSTAALLRSNVELNRLKNVRVWEMAASTREGALLLRADDAFPDADAHKFVVPTNQERKIGDELVQCDSLDHLFSQNSLERQKGIDLLIVDVEGAELSVIEGAVGLISSSPEIAVLLECTQHQESVEHLLRHLGFDFYVWDIAEYRLRECGFTQSIKTGNIIAIRGGSKRLPRFLRPAVAPRVARSKTRAS